MKKFIKKFALVIVLVFLMFSACNGAKDPGETSEDDGFVPEPLLNFQLYNLKTYVKPIWEGQYVYNETVMFLGADDSARLVYDIGEVLAVMSYDLTKVYEENVDYIIDGNYIKRTENSGIPYMQESEYYPSGEASNHYICTDGTHPYILYGEGETFTRYQVAVTYTHTQKWDGYVPQDESGDLPETIRKLENKEGLNILFYGDSITTGCNSSSLINIRPNADIWPVMVTKAIKEKYGYSQMEKFTDNEKRSAEQDVDIAELNEWNITKENDKINYINTAVGGQNSVWANATYMERVVELEPDLVFIAFGVNDVSRTTEWYKSQMSLLVTSLKEELPDVEIVLVSPIYPNAVVSRNNASQSPFLLYQDRFETELNAVAEENAGVVSAKVTSVYNRVLQNKRYRDMTGNNINHPNDFGARIYAQAILAALGVSI